MPLSNTTIQTLAGKPYWDDFDSSKRFHRVLIRTGKAVQTREVNQIQSIAQDQVSKLGAGIFKEGAAVVGGGATFCNTAIALQVVRDDAVDIDNFYDSETGVGAIVRGATSLAAGRVIQVAAQSDQTYSAVIIVPISSEKFVGGETVTFVTAATSSTIASMTLAPDPEHTKNAATYSIQSGTFFLRGHLVDVAQQTVVLSSNTNIVSSRVGLIIDEEIITEEDDTSLLDPAFGASNYAAPGAHRLRLTGTLTTLDIAGSTAIEQNSDENFIELTRVINGAPAPTTDRLEPTLIEETLARRTYDESGDYITSAFRLSAKDHTPPVSVPNATGTISGNATSTTINSGGVDTAFSSELTVGDIIIVNGERREVATIPSDSSLTVNSAFSIDFSNVAFTYVSSSKMNLELEAGKAYVRGHEFETKGTTILAADRARETANVNNGNVGTGFGPYVYATRGGATSAKLFDLRTMEKVDLHSLAVSDVNTAATLYAASKIGTARVRSSVYASGTGNSSTVYKLHLTGIEYASKILPVIQSAGGNAAAITGNNTYLAYNATTNAVTLDASAKTLVVRQEAANATGIGILPTANHAYDGALVTLYRSDSGTHSYYVTNSIASIASNVYTQTLTLDSSAFFDAINTRANVVISFTEKSLRGILLSNTKTAGASVDVLSKIGNISTGNTVLFGTDSPGLIFRFPESWIKANTITDDNFEAIEYFPSTTSSGSNATHTYYQLSIPTGPTDNVSFFPIANSGVMSKFTVANSTNGFVNLASASVAITGNVATLYIPTTETNGSAISAYAHVSVTIGTPRTKTLFYGNTNTSSVGTSGSDVVSNLNNYYGHVAINTINAASPAVVSLGVADVYALQKVYAVVTAGTPSTWVDVTDRYTLDNGQRNWCYDWASLVLKPGYTHYQGATRALAIIDRFSASANGFFTGKSYVGSGLPDEYVDIPTFVDTTTGTRIPLRDTVDFRPIRTANTIEANTASNPYVSANAVFGSQVLPHPDSTFEADYEYYLPRIDKVVLTQGKELKVIQGLPNRNPAPPSDAESSMTLYTVVYPAYTANVAEVKILSTDHRRYTMRDIGRLEKRIENLEYYVQLSLLEERTLNQTELDEADLERFKNGILIDPFSSYAVANAQDVDYRASIDGRRRELRPAFVSHGFKLGSFVSGNSTSVVKKGTGLDDVLMLDYDSQTMISQPLASTRVNVNPFNVAAWRGRLSLSPSTDQWMDTITRPTVVLNLYNENDGWVVGQDYGFGTIWGDWVDNWSGVTSSTSTSTVTGWSAEHDNDHNGMSEKYITTITTTTNSQTNTQTRTGEQTIARASIISTNLGERVVDTAIAPFMRSANVVITAQGLKPNANLVAFFDDKDVTMFVERANEIRFANSYYASLFTVGENVTSNAASVGTAKVAAIVNDTLRVVDATGKFWVSGGNVKITGATSGANVAVGEYVSWHGKFQGATNTSVLLLDAGSLPTTNAYYNNTIFITAGTGSGQRSRIIAYDSSTQAATIDPPIATLPTSSSHYSIGQAKADGLSTQITSGVGYSAANSESVFPGRFDGLFRLPGATRTYDGNTVTVTDGPMSFNTGRRVFRLSDNAAIGFATTQAEAAYEASGWTKTVESTVVNTRDIQFITVPVSQTGVPVTTTTTTSASNTVWTGIYVDPIAQTFLVDPQRFANGVFITSVDLFFVKKDTENIPVTVQIRPTLNGYPSADRWLTEATLYPRGGSGNTINIVPNNITPNPSNTSHVTRFTFPAPTYLAPGQEYSIVVLSDSFEYEVFVGEIGQPVVGSNRVISEQPYGGSFFKSQNARTWTAEQNQDLMFTINHAQFDASGIAALRLSETINSSSVGTDTSGNFDYDLLNVQTGHLEFAPTANSTEFNIAVIPVSTGVIGASGPIRVDQDIVLSERMRIKPDANVSVDFRITMGTDDTNVSPVYDLARLSLITVRNVVDDGRLYANGFTITNPGAGFTPGTFTITANDTYGNGATVVATVNSAGQVASIAVTVNGSGYVETPTLTWAAAASTNAVITYRGETNASCGIIGEQKARYITRRVELADGFDASDIKVYFTACRPPGTNVDVYCKVLASGDAEAFNNKPWQRMRIKENQASVYSRSAKTFHEYEYRTASNSASYTTNSVRYDRFHTFAIKVVLRSEDTAVVPRLRNLRAIALDE